MKDKLFVFSFLGIIFLIFAFFPIKHIFIIKGVDTLNLTDNWKFFTPQIEYNVIDKVENFFNSKKVSIENRVTNYFPFYIELNEFYQKLNFEWNRLLYDDIVPVKTNSNNEFIFYNEKDDFYYLENNYTTKDLDKMLLSQVEFFNNLSDKGMDIYIYLPTRYEFTTLKENNLNHYVEELKNRLNEKIHIEISNIKTIEEYKKYFYKTDHHWTMDGALQGYQSIMNMFELEPLSVTPYFLKNKRYYGSIARSSMNDITYDYLSDIEQTFFYDVTVNGSVAPKDFKPRTMSLRDYQYYDYYVQYFNGQYGEVIYDYHQEDKENLLIFGDSYAWQIDYLLAASFNKTYVINLNYDFYKNHEFSLEEYVKENNIDKIVFIQEGGATMFDQYDYGYVRKVK